MSAQDIRAAHRYATALFAAAKADNALETVGKEMNAVADLMQQNPALRDAWESPLLPASRKRDMMDRVLGRSLSPLSLSFLNLLIDKRREEIFDAVRADLGLLTDQNNHLLRAEAIFAIAPTPDEQAALVRSLEQRTGEHVQLAVAVDPALLGGVIVRMQDTILDGSVRGTLERLREQMLQDA